LGKSSHKVTSHNMTAKFQPVSSPAGWYGAHMSTPEKKKEWLYYLTPGDIAEIDAAVKNIVDNKLDILQVTRDQFKLPTFSAVLEKMLQDIVSGRGFVVIKGLPVHRYTRRESAIAYWGIGQYFGNPVSQNAKGHLLGHVKDIGKDPKNPTTRIYTTNARQPFHVDNCDIVGLLCLKPAKSGGLSTIASSVTVYNEMLKQNPKWVETLAQPFYYDRKNEVPEGKTPYYLQPAFHFNKGQLTTFISPDFIWSAQERFPSIPRLTQDQKEALEAMQTVPVDKQIRLDMELEPGDIQLLHNHQILHARTAYVDFDDIDQRRHLLRLWLATPNGRELPPEFLEQFNQITLGTSRCGIWVPGVKVTAPLEAE